MPDVGVADLAADLVPVLAFALELAEAGGVLWAWRLVPVAAIVPVVALGVLGARPLCVRNGIIA